MKYKTFKELAVGDCIYQFFWDNGSPKLLKYKIKSMRYNIIGDIIFNTDVCPFQVAYYSVDKTRYFDLWSNAKCMIDWYAKL